MTARHINAAACNYQLITHSAINYKMLGAVTHVAVVVIKHEHIQFRQHKQHYHPNKQTHKVTTATNKQ